MTKDGRFLISTSGSPDTHILKMCLKTKRIISEFCLDNGDATYCKDCQLKKASPNLGEGVSNSMADWNFTVSIMILSPSDQFLLLFKNLQYNVSMLIIRMRDFKLLKEFEFDFTPQGMV
jgi:hypothetical protein